jgi:hypothetical protein
MALYEVTPDRLVEHSAATFALVDMKERWDIQRYLREQIGVLGEDLKVIAEEFGDWEDARRRIDLLALDRSGRLVVIELKRTESAGHAELQGLRYAAMVSAMTFDEVASTYQSHLRKWRATESLDARTDLLAFLETTDEEIPELSSEVRIMLVAANFGRELTTCVLWLNTFEGMDIRCVRLVPYRVDDRTLIDVQQVVPLPEAADYQVRLRRKDQQRERVTSDNRDWTRYQIVVNGRALSSENKRNTVRVMVEQLVARGASIEDLAASLPGFALLRIHGDPQTPQEVEGAVHEAIPGRRADRFFLGHPLRQAGQTWVLSRGWGRNVEAILVTLQARFYELGVTFRVADE